jgi:hypothetical protein
MKNSFFRKSVRSIEEALGSNQSAWGGSLSLFLDLSPHQGISGPILLAISLLGGHYRRPGASA